MFPRSIRTTGCPFNENGMWISINRWLKGRWLDAEGTGCSVLFHSVFPPVPFCLPFCSVFSPVPFHTFSFPCRVSRWHSSCRSAAADWFCERWSSRQLLTNSVSSRSDADRFVAFFPLPFHSFFLCCFVPVSRVALAFELSFSCWLILWALE